MFSSEFGGKRRNASLWIVIALVVQVQISTGPTPVVAATDEISDDATEIQTYQQFLKVLCSNPRFGTAYDRVYEFHANRGTIQDFRNALAEFAGLNKVPAGDAISGVVPDNPYSEKNSIPTFPRQPDPATAALLAGMLDLQHVDSESAVAALELAVRARPESPIANWYLGKARVINRQLDLASEAFERAIACRPARTDLLEIYKELARTLQRSQQEAKALEAWRRLEELFPGDLRVKEQIAIALTQDGRWQDALARYVAMAADSKNPEQRVKANLAASDLMIQLGRTQESLGLLESQLEQLDPDSWLYREVRRRIEVIFRGQDDLPGLAAYYESWIAVHPDDIHAMARLGDTLSLQDRTADAAAWYRRAIELAPSNVALREALINQLVRDHKVADAIVQFEQMAEFDSGNPDHIEDWGKLYLSQTEVPPEERRAKAAAVWERLLINRADDPVTIVRLAILFRQAELQGRALALYQSAIDKAPADPQYREYLGEYLHQLHRTDEAVTVWNGIAADDRKSKSNLIRLAEVLERFGQIEAAIAAMREACHLNPEPAERIRFATMLRIVADHGSTLQNENTIQGPTETPVVNQADTQRLTESLQQLVLAEDATDSPDERQLILRERITTLMAAGQLDANIQQLTAELNAGTNSSPERWLSLSLYHEAADQLSDAIAAALQVVALEPRSVAGWSILAGLYERTGQLGNAIEAMRQLASIDRRGISEYLRKTARFEVRLGQFDEALKTAREVIQATPGNPDAYQFFADLAFEAGQPRAALDALRQSVRINPGDEASLRTLAKTLSDEFQTTEAIGLYWRAFERAQDLDSQNNIVAALSNLYLRSNQFPKLIERLELRSRELNLPTEMTRCIATAWREAGDFRKSRDTLERLTVDDPHNVGLLKELRTLAEQEHNITLMQQYQRRIVELTGADVERRLLIDFLGQEGLYAEAARERLRLAESRTDRVEMLKEIEILVAGGYDDLAEMLCRRLLESSSDDWAALNAWRGVLLRRHKLSEARDVSRRIVRLSVDFDEPSVVSGSSGSTASAMDTATTFSRWLAESTTNPAGSFGAVYCESALSLVFRVGTSTPPEDISTVFASHLSDRDRLRLVAFLTRSVNVRNPAGGELWAAMEDFIQGSPHPARTAVQLFETCQRYAANDLTADGQAQLKVRAIVLLKQLIVQSPVWLNQTGLPILNILPKEGAESEIAAVIEAQLAAERGIPELGALWSLANTIKSPQLLKKMFTVSAMRLQQEPDFAADLEAALTGEDSASAFNATVLQTLQHDPESLLAMLDFWVTCGLSKDRTGPLIQSMGFLTIPEILNNRLGETAGSTLVDCIRSVVAAHAETQVTDWCRVKLASASSSASERSTLHLILAELATQLSDDVTAIASLINAAEEDPEVHDFRFLIAQKAARQGWTNEAILLLDAMNLTDAARQIAREEFVLQQLFPAGPSERCTLAAERLFGLPLNMDQQRNLIPMLDKLGMQEKVAAIQTRFGRGVQDRQSILGALLQTDIASGKNELAGEVAWELLKLASGGSLFSGHRPDDDRDDGGERLQAIRALGKLNRLQPVIDRYEAMLAQAPKSVELLEILAEFHEAAEQWDLLSAKRDRIALLSKKAPPSLKAKAAELERSGDVSGACDVYLTILQDDPAAFSDEMETYVQAFERAKRQADFLSAVLSLKPEFWNEHAGLIINIITELAHAGTSDDIVRDSIARLLASTKTRRLTIGGLLARPDVVPEKDLLPAIRIELESDQAFSDFSSCNETFLLLQGVQQQSSLLSLRHVVSSWQNPGHQPPDSNVTAEDGQTRDPSRDSHPTADAQAAFEVPAADAVLIYLDARLGNSSEVESRITQLLNNADASRGSMDLLIALNERLKIIGSNLNITRQKILEFIASRIPIGHELADRSLEELGAVYMLLGRTDLARGILNQRVQRLLTSTGADRAHGVESIRDLLQAGEKIQHSGFPIEGARLLLNVTSHDIEEFTRDLDADKAVAFKSRFNASQRWARQQISADKLVAWFTIAVEQTTFVNGPSDVDSSYSDILLELTGTTDPRCRDASALKSLRVNSAILTAIGKLTFDDAQLATLKAGIEQLSEQELPPASLLAVGLSLALQLNDLEHFNSFVATVSALNLHPRSSESDTESKTVAIPQTLRSSREVSLVLAAKTLLSNGENTEAIGRLLAQLTENTSSIGNRLVRIAVLNECLGIATQAGLRDVATVLEAERDLVIGEQIGGTHGTSYAIDLREEIRTRLLGLQ